MKLYEYHTNPEGLKWYEYSIRNISRVAYWYAHDVICRPWPDGEKAIMSDKATRFSYRFFVRIFYKVDNEPIV